MTTATTTEPDYPADHPDRIRLAILDGQIVHAPDEATIELNQLMNWSKAHAAVLVIRGAHGCKGAKCAGHVPLQPAPGEILILGRRDNLTAAGIGPGRAVYRVTELVKSTVSARLERVA